MDYLFLVAVYFVFILTYIGGVVVSMAIGHKHGEQFRTRKSILQGPKLFPMFMLHCKSVCLYGASLWLVRGELTLRVFSF